VSKQRYYRLWFQNLAAFVDRGVRTLSRSELATYLILLRDTRPNGTARAGLNDLAERGGMSRKSASRAIGSLVAKGVLTIVRRGRPGKPTLYTVFPAAAFRELNPVAAQWLEDGIWTDVGE
jgi:DNA-binding MarR family transcriptional regulator